MTDSTWWVIGSATENIVVDAPAASLQSGFDVRTLDSGGSADRGENVDIARRWQMLFNDRIDAGTQLAERLRPMRGSDVVVLGLPRGGVPVALQVALMLGAPLDVIVVRKLGVPFRPELAMGAIGEGGVRISNDDVVHAAHVTEQEFAAVEAREQAVLTRRAQQFRSDRQRISLNGRIAIVVDDGVATGSTARAACEVARLQGASKVVLAVPVAPPNWTAGLSAYADELVCLSTPNGFSSVGQWYSDFSPITDEEVVDCLARASTTASTAPTSALRAKLVNGQPECDEDVQIQAGGIRLAGRLTLPREATGIAVFAHGSGSSRYSRRNRFVAEVLNKAGLGTLLFDLLTVDEESERVNVFDIELLGRRLVDVTRALRVRPDTSECRIGYFGASAGAAAALWAAAELGDEIGAVVSRGGRPDLTGSRLALVTAPTLLIVGSQDAAVLSLNREARARLRCENRLVVVPGASHVFEEPGALHEVAVLACDWFVSHVSPAPHWAVQS